MGRLGFAFAASAVLCAAFGGEGAWAAQPKAAVEGDMKSALRSEIVAAVGDVDKPIANRFEARRRAQEAAADAIAVLRSEGYYGYEVTPDVSDADPPQPQVRVTPGPRFRIRDPKIDWMGAAPLGPAQQAAEALMGLADGEPARAADVISAEGRVVAAVQKRGYADAAAQPRVVTVDHADLSVQPSFKIAAGDLVRLDGLKITSTARTRADWLRGLAPWKPGDVYDPDAVARLERMLLDTQVYDSVTVALAPKEETTASGERPVIVSLADRAQRRLELGASYGTTDGPGVNARWTWFDRLGRADTLSVFGQASSLDSRAGVEASLPHWRRAQQTLKGTADVYRTQTSAYRETGIEVVADVERHYTKTSYVTVGASLGYSVTDETVPTTLQPLGPGLVTGALLGVLALDRSDNPLDPKQGWRVEARTEPTVIIGGGALSYLKVSAQGVGYLPFDAKGVTVLAGRLKVGSILGGDTVDAVPASRRFYSGGGGSVRGYAYQAIGPHLADNTPEGGLSLIEASVELRHKFGPHWGGVVFVDAGSIGSSQIPNGDNMDLGAGFGVRYDLGFGPIRADLAFPLHPRSNDARFQIYLSIGQSF